MKDVNLRNISLVSTLIVLMLNLTLLVEAQEKPKMKRSDSSKPSNTRSKSRSDDRCQRASPPKMEGLVISDVPFGTTLVDAKKQAEKKQMTIEVITSNITIVDPAKVRGKPNEGQGHIHYKLDDGPIIEETSRGMCVGTPLKPYNFADIQTFVGATVFRRTFTGLSSGDHALEVFLVGNDHSQIKKSKLSYTIP